ncbi:putative recombination endonuclease subunit D12 [Pectobacterium phage DU_PP_V]|uniref:Putative recombination endonuclease subunit D12 n=1 Tax=Pectobacterium phage DU_PP_V TaxID=2041492 RepID=A0A2D2W713_9CAUD|nr:putative recombination endonuclease subunit D12 [Pectobacterium phage DU_PP_V]ATS94085.1 putative recombination endonuclease subunit D12 [Pectobacterium phage DU_PP_V]
MRILFTADHHIKLKSKQVPKDWQKNRFDMLANNLVDIFDSNSCDLHIIGGDLLDVAHPSMEELELMFSFLAKLKHKGIIYTGNHEALNKNVSCMYYLADAIQEVTKGNWTVITEPYRSPEFDIVDFVELHKKEWKDAHSNLCFTHVRGCIPPHVEPEIDLKRFVDAGYSLVVAGDLHSYQNSQSIEDIPLVYPGSPMTTSFHRSRTTNTNGALLIDTDTLSTEWVDLSELPQLIRLTVSNKEEMIKTDYDHTIYEVSGDVLDLKALARVDSEIFDKKINNTVTSEAKLNLEGLSIAEEAALYLSEIQNLASDKISRVVGRIQKYVQGSI